MEEKIERLFIKPKEAAKILGVDRRTIENYLHEGILEGVKLGRSLFVRKEFLTKVQMKAKNKRISRSDWRKYDELMCPCCGKKHEVYDFANINDYDEYKKTSCKHCGEDFLLKHDSFYKAKRINHDK